jgi:LysR family hca operon transcriptional activator
VVRPLHGEPATIDLVMDYSRSNTSALLKRFVSRADKLVASVSKKADQGNIGVS